MDMEKMKKNLESFGYAVSEFNTKEEAANHVAAQLKGEVVGFGGSQTVEALGLYELLGKNNTVCWHWKVPTDRDRFREFTVYMCSVNAIAETGEIVNIDGTGNRLAGTLYGVKKLYYFVGKNKITPDLESAIYRARNVAAPLNAKRFNLPTPCTADMKCHDCRHPKRICNGILITPRKMKSTEYTEIVFINEDLGM